MRKVAPGSTGPRILIGFVVVLAILGLLLWRSLMPKIRTATPEQVRAVLPKEILVPDPQDPAAQTRYTRFATFMAKTDFKSAEGLIDTKKTPANIAYAATQKFWADHPKLIGDVLQILNSGPIQAPVARQDEFIGTNGFFSNVRTFVKIVELSGRLYADHGDFEQSTRMHLLGISLADKMMASGGPMINYLVAVANESIVNSAIDKTAMLPVFPADDCQKLLTALTPSLDRDTLLANSIKRDFTQFALNLLPDPMKRPNDFIQQNEDPDGDTTKEPIVGTYEPIETAQLFGGAVAMTMANAQRPYSKLDRSISAAFENDSRQLPQPPDSSEPDGIGRTLKKWKYRFLMDNIHNSLGRQFASSGVMDENATELSCRWRAQRNATRVLLASRIYRSSHGGKLPETVDGFVPLLGKWPQDPYNGLAMIYNAKTEKVYSIGKNLIDDGGDIGVDLLKVLDIGLSLKI